MPYATVDQYLAAQPAATRAVLRKVRAILRKALPGADEVISHQIPAYKSYGRVVMFFAGWKEHYSIYPITGATLAHFKQELGRAELSNKGTARFSLTEPIPASLLTRIAKFLAARTLERVNTRAATKQRATKKRATKQRVTKQRATKQRATNKRATKKRATKRR